MEPPEAAPRPPESVPRSPEAAPRSPESQERPKTQRPGEVVPPAARRILERPPSDRYASMAAQSSEGQSPDTASGPIHGSAPRAAVVAAIPALGGAAILVLLGSPLALVEPLVAIAVLLGVGAGLGARWGGGTAVARPRRRAIAMVASLVAVALADFIVWRLALAEGGVLPFVDYHQQVFGPVAILQPLAAAVAAWASA